jgi:branched-chain amino acid transport system substrate-binding protein
MRRAPASARSAVEIAAAFRDDPAVVAVVGHTESDATVSAAAVYEDREGGGRRALIAISPTAAAPGVTESEWVFRVCPPVERQAEAMASYLADSLAYRRVAVVYRNDSAGKGFTRGFVPALRRAGAVDTERDPFVEEIPEFEAYAKRMGRRGSQGVGFFGNASDALALLRELHAAGSAAVLIGANPPSDSMLMDAETARQFSGARFAALYAADRPVTETGRRFAAGFRRRFGGTPDHWGALGYDAAQLIGRAVHEVGADRARVRGRVAQVGRDKPAFEGATGQIRFDAAGDPIDKPVTIVRVP